MHTIRFRGCVARQDNHTMDVFVEGQGYGEKQYADYGRLSGKELRTVVMRYLNDNGWVKPAIK